MQTVDAIVDSLGGPAVLGKLIRVSTQAVWNMKARGSIPPEYWQEIVAEADRRAIPGLTLEALASIAARRRGSLEPPSEATA